MLLAGFGYLGDARRIFQRSLSISSQPEGWHNVSVVHARIGEAESAAQARRQGRLAAQRAGRDRSITIVPGDLRADIRWVDAATFAGTSGAAGHSTSDGAETAASSQPARTAAVRGKKLTGWLRRRPRK